MRQMRRDVLTRKVEDQMLSNKRRCAAQTPVPRDLALRQRKTGLEDSAKNADKEN